MENAVDALKIAFAIFVFVLAITLTFSMISKAKSTADSVLYYADETNYYDHVESKIENRTVSVADVISSLHRYYKESLCVTINLNGEQREADNAIRVFDLTKKYADTDEIEKEIAKYINDELLYINDNNYVFEEEFVEIPISGIYETGDDGTQIVLSSGGKKVYVTYTLISK